MFYKISDFVNDWQNESQATLKLFNCLTDQSLKQKVTEEGRSLGTIAWHITTSFGEMLKRTGLNPEGPEENAPEPESAKEIAEAYSIASESVLKQITENWNDETLFTEDNMYGEMWKKSLTLTVLLVHQIHHRGQMTVLMRQAGLVIPGLYGPAKEEWAQFGMPAAK
ncbi:MAG: DinB family protein [Bacillota bacterium]